MIPSEFKKLKDLRLIDDKGIKPDMLLLLEGGDESLSVLLSQIKSWVLNETIDSLTPVGSPIFWPNDKIPYGYAKINEGLDFNVIQYPQLALAWPSGKIPPHKGLVIECTADGAVTGETLQGDIKSHKHAGSIAEHQSQTITSSTDQSKTITSSAGGGHTPQITVDLHEESGYNGTIGSGGGSKEGSETFSGNAVPSHTHDLTLPSHNHTLAIPSHTHGMSIDNTGASRNTVDRINYNVIVRLA